MKNRKENKARFKESNKDVAPDIFHSNDKYTYILTFVPKVTS